MSKKTPDQEETKKFGTYKCFTLSQLLFHLKCSAVELCLSPQMFEPTTTSILNFRDNFHLVFELCTMFYLVIKVLLS